MSWRKRELDFPHDFKSEMLNVSPPANLKNSVLVGRDSAAPRKGVFENGRSGVFSGATVTSGNSNGFVVRPRYRGSVRDYFKETE